MTFAFVDVQKESINFLIAIEANWAVVMIPCRLIFLDMTKRGVLPTTVKYHSIYTFRLFHMVFIMTNGDT